MLRKTCAVLASSAEIVINVHWHLTAVRYNQSCKEPYRSSFPLRLMRLVPSGIGLCLFGIRLTHHPPPRASYLFDVSRWLIVLTACDYFFLSFRIAIWNRNMVMSLIAVGAWLASVVLNIRSMSRIPTCSHCHLISPACACEDLTMVRRFTNVLVARTDAYANLNKIGSVYDSIANACAILHTATGLVNAIGVLVADAVLLLTMLVGLLRHPHRSSTGMWKFLYQQVTHVRFSSVRGILTSY